MTDTNSFNPALFAAKNQLLVVLAVLGCFLLGVLAFREMPRLEDPAYLIRTAVVFTPYPGATPEEVTREVTETLETAIQELTEVETINSVSTHGLSRIEVEIDYNAAPQREDLERVWTKLRARVADAQRLLPPNAARSIVNDDFGDVYGLYYLVTGEGFSMKELADYAEDLRTELLAVDGVGKVIISGEQREAIYIEIGRERSAALGLSIGQIFQDLAQQNAVISAGDVQIGDRRLIIQPAGGITSVAALSDLVISTPQADTVVRLGEVARITRGPREPATFLMRFNGTLAIGLGVAQRADANIVEVGEAVDQRLDALITDRPYGIEVRPFYHQGEVVEKAVSEFSVNVLFALIIVNGTIMAFMGLRLAFIIGTVLILSIAGTLAIMWFVDIPMHRVSLGALVIALGMIVDNAIVIAEGILSGRRRAGDLMAIAGDVVRRSQWPLLAGTLVGMIAFAPIGFAPGGIAELTRHLTYVVAISLSLSYIFALMVVPLLAVRLFPGGAEAGRGDGSAGLIWRGYRQFIRATLFLRFPIILGATLLLFGAIAATRFVPDGFFPPSATPQLIIDYWFAEGTDIDRTIAGMTALEEEVSKIEGVEDVHAVIGGGGMRYMLVYSPPDPNPAMGRLLVRVESSRFVDPLMTELQERLPDLFPDGRIRLSKFQLGPTADAKIEAVFSGPDPSVLRQLAEQAKGIMAADPDADYIRDDWRQPVPVIVPTYSSNRGRRLGISREDLADALRTNYSGQTVGIYREGEDLIPIIARPPIRERAGADQIAQIQIPSQTTSRAVPLSEVVDTIETQWRDANLRRTNRILTIKAQADPLPGVLPSTLFERLRPQIEAMALPAGYRLTWAGEYGDSSSANSDLATTLPLGFAAMVLVTVALFGGLRQTLIVWVLVPLSVIGVVAGLVITQTPLEFMAILGVLSLSGLLIKNSIVLVSQIDMEIEGGKPRYDAILDSATSRVRPVLLGTLTTVLGVLPLMTDGFFRSMAIVIAFGLSFATLLTLILAPILYATFFGISSKERAPLAT